MNRKLDLFLTFAKIGALTFGGGYAMLAILQREVVETHRWATEEDIADYYAIGQCTPGIIAVNTATFVGRKVEGFWGSLLATAGIIFPSLVIITVIAAFLTNFAEYALVRHAFAGIRVCVCVLILNSLEKLLKGAVKDRATAAIFAAVFLLMAVTGLSPVIFVAASALCGVLLQVGKERNR